MKKLIPVLALTALSLQVTAQISITAADMPVAGDTLRYSTAIAAGLSTSNTGANSMWDFTQITPLVQAVDTYKLASQVSFTYASLGTGAYGYKLGDSIPGMSAVLPVSVSNVYNFFAKKTSPSRFVNNALGASVSGFGLPFTYSDDDEWYFFPLNYGNNDTSTFQFTASLATFGSLSRQGTRTTSVDGWGTITTPYYTTPVNCIRVRSVVDEVDSFTFSGTTTGLPAIETVEYKWLVAGEHYPAMWITATSMNGNETNTAARYRDSARSTILAVPSMQQPVQTLTVYPSPAHSTITLQLPAAWQQYQISVYDMQGKAVLTAGTKTINIEKLPAGTYLIRAVSGTDQGIARFTKN